MLDFYLLEGDILTHNKLSRKELLGQLDYSEFEELQQKKIIESHLDFYKDFRWTNEQVNKKLDILMADTNSWDYKLTHILKKASSANGGLIANAD